MSRAVRRELLIVPPTHLHNISPDWQGSTDEEQRIIQRILKFAETPRAITEFDRKAHRLSDYWYWFTLSTLWVSYTGWSALDTWRKLLSSDRANRATSLMKPDEYRCFQALPDEVTVYRAHRPGETDWIAYTLNPQIAARFARERGVSQITEYTLPRTAILALFLRRGEYEVLSLDRAAARKARDVLVILQ